MACTKKTEIVGLYLLGCNEEQVSFQIQDTLTEPMGHNVFEAFKRKDQMSFKMDNNGETATILVPFHAVDKLTHRVSSTTVDCRPDAYCPE